jgi:hypothetical protein
MSDLHTVEPEPRTCANCACCLVIENPTNPMEKQSFCRRNGAMHGEMRIDVPRKDRAGNIINGRDGKPIMEQAKQSVYLYPPTQPALVCFDGWRPMGTQPGDMSYKTANEADKMMERWQEGMRRLQEDLVMEAAERPVVRSDVGVHTDLSHTDFHHLDSGIGVDLTDSDA